MPNRRLNHCAAASAVAFCLVLLAWIGADTLDPRTRQASLPGGLQVCVSPRGSDARLEVFNDATYGPYTGSIIGIAGDPNGPVLKGFGEFAGIYYRDIRWPNGASLWTFSVSLWYPLAATAIVPAAWVIRRTLGPRRRPS